MLTIVTFVCFLISFAAGVSSSSATKVNWSDVMAVASMIFTAVMAIVLWLMNRKHDAEQELRKKSQDQLDEAIVRVRECDLARQQAMTQLEQVRRDIDSLQESTGNLADDATVTDIREELRSTKRNLEEARITLAGHQNTCADRFVHRSSYSEDQRAQREAIGLLHDMLKQQRDLIERIR